MSGFKKGDRVRVTHDGAEGAQVQAGDIGTVAGVRHDGRTVEVLMDHPRSSRLAKGAEYHWVFGPLCLDLVAAPRMDSPKVGDTVRVVLEGKVTEAGASWWTLLPTGTRKAPIYHQVDWVKSIEVITPAKPSVKDLPVGSVIMGPGEGLVYVKRAENHWRSTAGLLSNDADLPATWTLLVPEKKEEGK